MRGAAEGARRLEAALLAEGGALGQAVAAAPRDPVAPCAGRDGDASHARTGGAQLAAAGPRARGREAEYELLLEMILEGVLLHYGGRLQDGRPPVVSTADPDLALLLGDQLYALGLSRLAALGDLEAVGELGDVISLVAQAAAGGDHELIAATWAAGTAAIGWGGDPAYQQAKALARAESPAAAGEMRAAAGRMAGLTIVPPTAS